MIVAYSRPIAMKIYRKLLELRPAWKEKIGVVMTSGNNDPEDWKAIIGTKSHKEELARKFKDNDDPMKIAIVVDMWLTGFDVPSLATMYIYKPMHGYNLMQAIARVNRVFKDKEGGLIVDYVGIASALKAAMKEYTKRDQSRYGDMDISKVAYPKFQEKLQVCKDLLHGFDFSSFIDGSPLVMAKLVTGGVNFVLDAKAPKRKDLFLREAMLLKQSHSLCSSMTTEQERHEAAYMEAVRSTVVKITYGGSGGKTLSLKEINTQINELLKASIQSQGVISLFDSKQAGGIGRNIKNERKEHRCGNFEKVDGRTGITLQADKCCAVAEVLGENCAADELLLQWADYKRGSYQGTSENGTGNHRVVQ